MRAGIGRHLSENGNGERVGHFDVLGRFYRHIGDGKTACAVLGRLIRDGTDRSSPVDGCKFEWDSYLHVTAIGSFAVSFIVVASKIGNPL